MNAHYISLMVGAQCKYPPTLTLAFFFLPLSWKNMVLCGLKKKKRARKGQCSCRACGLPQMPMAGLPWWAKVKNRFPMEGTQVQSLVRELRSRVRRGH